MNKRTKACDISTKVKDEVWERDNHKCIICGSYQAMPNAHYISRAKGGLGIPQNIVTLCLNCHSTYDQSPKRKSIQLYIKRYLQLKYKDWNEENLIYKKP